MKSSQITSTIILAVILTILGLHYQFSLIYLWIGLFFGNFLYHLDHLIYCLIEAPYEFTAQRIKRMIEQKQFRQGLDLLTGTEGDRKRTIFHSVVFQAGLVVACFLILTSSSSLVGKGMVIGLLLHSLVEQGRSLARKEAISDWFWQIKTEVSSTTQTLYFLSLVILFLIFIFFFF
jgi:hypothetical protein